MTNTLYTNDNLFILTGMNSNSVDLIYLDPPFNSKRFYAAPVGSKAAGTSFKDMWTWQDVNEAYLETLANEYPALALFIGDVGAIHSSAMKAYLTYMAQRIIEMHRVLKDTGSIYLHCDPTASHYLKIALDEIFGKNNFRNEITWERTTNSGSSKGIAKKFPNDHDTIFFYTKQSNIFKFNNIFKGYSQTYINHYYIYDDNDGKGKYQLQALRTVSSDRLKKLKAENRIVKGKGKYLRYKDYLNDKKGVPVNDMWYDIEPVNPVSKERTGYPTQKPLALLHRIIKASSSEGDIVLDPFCGCATTCVAAQQLNRKWIGIDIAEQASDVLVQRLSDDAGLFKDFVNTAIVPQRTDIKKEEKSTSVKERLYEKQNSLCNGCGFQFNIQNLEIDHIIPKAKGGGDYYENYQLLCGSCNRIKGDRPMEYLQMKVKTRQETMKNKIIFGE